MLAGPSVVAVHRARARGFGKSGNRNGIGRVSEGVDDAGNKSHTAHKVFRKRDFPVGFLQIKRLRVIFIHT